MTVDWAYLSALAASIGSTAYLGYIVGRGHGYRAGNADGFRFGREWVQPPDCPRRDPWKHVFVPFRPGEEVTEAANAAQCAEAIRAFKASADAQARLSTGYQAFHGDGQAAHAKAHSHAHASWWRDKDGELR